MSHRPLTIVEIVGGSNHNLVHVCQRVLLPIRLSTLVNSLYLTPYGLILILVILEGVKLVVQIFFVVGSTHVGQLQPQSLIIMPLLPCSRLLPKHLGIEVVLLGIGLLHG